MVHCDEFLLESWSLYIILCPWWPRNTCVYVGESFHFTVHAGRQHDRQCNEITKPCYGHLEVQAAHRTSVTMETTETLWNETPLQRLDAQRAHVIPLAYTMIL